MNLSRLALASSLLLVSVAGAQTPTYWWSPRDADKNIGGSNNTIPWWGMSASYQQIHDAIDFGPTPKALKGMAFRPAGARTLTGRSWEVKITLTHTKVNSGQMSTTFSTNLTGTNTTVVFGSTTTFTKFTWPTSTSSGSGPHAPTFTIPFVNAYLYIPTLGNLCWDWRHKNASTNATIPMDAASGGSHRGTVLSTVGTGCKVGSNTATASIANSTTGPRGYVFQSTLANATSNQNAIMALGVTPKNQNLGWCTALELVPAAFVFGKTDSSGSWAFSAPVAAAAGAPATSFYVQYAYADSSQAAGLGLSNMAGYTTPNLPGGSAMSRMWNTPAFNTSNGHETATTGTVGLRYGLIVGWQK